MAHSRRQAALGRVRPRPGVAARRLLPLHGAPAAQVLLVGVRRGRPRAHARRVPLQAHCRVPIGPHTPTAPAQICAKRALGPASPVPLLHTPGRRLHPHVTVPQPGSSGTGAGALQTGQLLGGILKSEGKRSPAFAPTSRTDAARHGDRLAACSYAGARWARRPAPVQPRGAQDAGLFANPRGAALRAWASEHAGLRQHL
jgi:hypothetical protein